MKLVTSAALLSVLGTSAQAAEAIVPVTRPHPNRVSLGGLFLLNASVSFEGTSFAFPGPATGAAAGGLDHFYDDGFNRVDSSGNQFPPGATSFWGYQSAGQLVDSPLDPAIGIDSIAMHAASSAGTAVSPGDSSELAPGVELTYGRVLGHSQRITWGVEGGLGYMGISSDAQQQGTVGVTSITDLYGLTVNGVLVTPPPAPYSGPFQAQPGSPLLSDNPTRLMSTVPGSTSSRRELDASLVTIRVGPFLDYSFTEKLSVGGGAGLAFIFANSTFDYADSVTYNPGTGPITLQKSGSESSSSVLIGGYVGARVRYDFTDQWGVFGRVDYLGASEMEVSGGNQTARLNLSTSFLLSLGATFNF